jgi:epoxide hydrolase
MIEPFRPVVADQELRDLRTRLRATRWPEPETDPSQGVALADLQELCRYWAESYDWRACEKRLAAVGQYRTTIDGLGICFLHARSPRADALPLHPHPWMAGIGR